MIMIQTKNVMHRDLNNLYGWASYQLMVSNGEKTSTDLMKNSKKIMMKTVTNHISAKLVFSIPRSYLSYPIICCSNLNEWKLKNMRNLCLNYTTKKTFSYATKPWRSQWIMVQIVLMLIEMIQVAGLKPYEDLYMKLRAMILRKPSSSW